MAFHARPQEQEEDIAARTPILHQRDCSDRWRSCMAVYQALSLSSSAKHPLRPHAVLAPLAPQFFNVPRAAPPTNDCFTSPFGVALRYASCGL